ncbi:S-layer homology domain-containing protein [Pelotomaculum propionicicum]|nr:S-layer homology domain-containing protein [Pelotomaculum propionicicum]
MFSDTSKHWAVNYIAGANEAGIASGYSEDSIGPDKEI